MAKRTSVGTSVRRHFIDQFFFSHRHLIRGKVIDIGGKRVKKRGLFDIDKLGVEVTYVNIEKKDEPDILSDAASIPLPDNSFDTAILAELLEHVPEPKAVLKEAYRLLKPDGVALITAPFMVGIHADPYDYGRYTETFWRKVAQDLGFKVTEIEKQGTMFAVAGLMLQHLFLAKGVSWRPVQFPLIKFLMWLDRRTIIPALTAWTLGYGIVLTK